MMETKTNRNTLIKFFALVLTAAAIAFQQVSPIVISYAELNQEANGNESSAIGKIVRWAASVCAGIVAIFLMVSIVKDAVGYAKGQGSTSVFKIIGKVVFMIMMVAIIFIASNVMGIKNKGTSLVDAGLNTISNSVNEMGQ